MTIVDLVGFVILAIAIYMVVTRVAFPYFRSPRMSRKEREQLVQDAQSLLDSTALTDDERRRIREAMNTLQADTTRQREAWGGRLPVADSAATIKAIRDQVAARDAK